MNRFPRRSASTFVAVCALFAANYGSLPNSAAQPPAAPKAEEGVTLNTPEAFQGYSLIAPLNSNSSYLVDMDGRVVKTWKSEFHPGCSAYLLPSGDLLRAGEEQNDSFRGPGAGGRIQKFSWDGELLWDYALSTDRMHPHHDIHPMPGGNVLVVAWDKKTKDEAIAAGRRADLVRGEEFLPDCILEIKPTGATTGEIVWEWHAWDHLIQDVDPEKPNYGEIAEHPELIDVNFTNDVMANMLNDPQQLANLRSLGYVGGGAPRPNSDDEDEAQDENADEADESTDDEDPPGDGRRRNRRGGGRRGFDADWMHTNGIDYNADLDQIMLSLHSFSEVWIIDHSTTTAVAASHSGGRYGKGGDLLYRWGNPRAYRNGSNVDQRLFSQHNAQWIRKGLPGAGNMLVFNNGNRRPDGEYSTVDEIVLPMAEDGSYVREDYLAYGPEKATWSYSAPQKSSFFSTFISGAQRLPNGNTFICSGASGTVFEVTPVKETVWQYKHPGLQGGPFGMSGPRPGELFPGFVRDMLQMTDDQRKSLDELQADVDAKLENLLTKEQQEKRSQPPRFGQGFGAFGGGPPRPRPDDDQDDNDRGDRRRGRGRGGSPPIPLPRPGEVIPGALADSLELSVEQQVSLEAFQKEVDARLKNILAKEQQDQLDEMQQAMSGRRGFGPMAFGPPRDGPPGAGPPGGPGPDGDRDRGDRGRGRGRGGRGGPGGPGGIFRSYRYGTDYAGLAGKDLTPGEKLVDILAKEQTTPPEEPPSDEPNS